MHSNHRTKKPFLFVGIIAALLLTCAPQVYAQKNILVLGDSLSAGYGLGTTEGWVYLLQQQLASELKDISVFNASVNGETTHGGLARLPRLLASKNFDIVILELGANDGLRGAPLQITRANLESMVGLSQQAGARVLLVGMHIPPNYGHKYTSLFYAQYASIADKFELSLVPFLLDGVATQPELMQADGLHPTATAQPRLLNNVLALLRPMLQPTLAGDP